MAEVGSKAEVVPLLRLKRDELADRHPRARLPAVRAEGVVAVVNGSYGIRFPMLTCAGIVTRIYCTGTDMGDEPPPPRVYSPVPAPMTTVWRCDYCGLTSLQHPAGSCRGCAAGSWTEIVV